MATKSDLAQKLLHDLRLRKERMASSSSKPMSRGAHGNPGTAHKGSKKFTALESVGSRSANSIRKTSTSTRSSFHMEDSSNQIVLYGGGRNSEHRRDLSTNLSFAFENGGKFGRIDSSGSNPVLSFLHYISKGSIDTGRMEIRSNMGKKSSTSQFRTYSHIHIHDISKGVQKLNQILRTCSNGVNFDGYSIEVGKELLRGAMDLEESLRMLVNLQEASDYMVYSQKKNKIKLLEEDEDDQSEISKANDLRIVDRPKFSFDKPRNQHSSKEAAPNYRKQQVMALTYGEETPMLQEKQPRRRSNSSHSRSPSCVPDLKALSTYLEPKGHTRSHSKPEKGRISNVIAKLMGLEELSPKEECRATLRELSANKNETMASMRSPIKVESQRHGKGKGQPVVDNKNTTSAIRTSIWDTRSMLEEENIRASPKGSYWVDISDSHWQNLEVAARRYASSGSKTTTIVKGKQPNGINQGDQMPGYKAISQGKEKEESNKDDKEKKISMTGENKDLLTKDLQQQIEPETHIPPKAEDVSQENIELKRTATKTRNKNMQSLQTSKQQNTQDNHELQRPQVLKKSDHLERKQKQDLPNQKKANEFKGHQVEAMVTTKPNRSARSLQKKKSCDTLPTAATNKKKTTKYIDAKPLKELPNSRIREDRGVHKTSTDLPPQRKKENYMKAFQRQTHQADATSNTRNGTSNALARSLDHESPVRREKKMQNNRNLSSCNGVEQETSTHSEESKVGIIGLDKPEKNTDSSNAEDLSHNVAEEVNFSHSVEYECQVLEVSKPQPAE